MDTLAHPATRDTAASAAVQRRLFTGDDLEQMVRKGIIDESERIELIAGEIVAMSAKGNFHEIVRNRLTRNWAHIAPMSVEVFGETPLRLSPTDQPEPDIIVFAASISLPDVRGPTVDLVVEVSDSSLGYDLGIKSLLYASFGVREFWVIDPVRLETYVHLDPVAGKYQSVTKHVAGDMVTPQAAPFLVTRLSAFAFDWV
jgi:Uma2 family endonuclease